MEPLIRSAYCDAISENRNKAYGQYELRTSYVNRLFKAQTSVLGVAGFTTLLLLWLSSQTKARLPENPMPPVIFREVELTVLEPLPNMKLKDKPAPKPKSNIPPVETFADPIAKPVQPSLPLEVAKDPLAEKIDSISTKASIPTSSIPNQSGLIPGAIGGFPGGLPGGSNSPLGSDGGGKDDALIPVDFPEENPEFQGNLEAFLAKSTRYPMDALSEGVEGQVFVCFIVDEKGKVTKPEVLKGIGFGCDEEALRVIRNLPDWKPGKMNGRPVKVRMRVPFRFKLK